MEEIRKPVNIDLIKSELTEERFLRYTSKGQNELYLVNAHNSPNIMEEIGRLRELAFRMAGGGTGKASDIDEYDTCDFPYDQLILWNPDEDELIAGYRLLNCHSAMERQDGIHLMATSHLFDFSKKFLDEYLPFTYELGRSFVQPKYQRGTETKKGIFALDNLWEGIGALIHQHPDIKYLFGKVTMYPSYNREIRNLILAFMEVQFPDVDNLVYPWTPLVSEEEKASGIEMFSGLSYKEAHALLNQHARANGLNIPPLINSYMNLSPNMKTFGTALNDEFGDVEETGILVTIEDIYEAKKLRYIDTFTKYSKFGTPPWQKDEEE